MKATIRIEGDLSSVSAIRAALPHYAIEKAACHKPYNVAYNVYFNTKAEARKALAAAARSLREDDCRVEDNRDNVGIYSISYDAADAHII